MGTTKLRKSLFLFFLPLLAVVCTVLGFKLSSSSFYNYEKAIFFLLGLLGAILFFWLSTGIILALLIKFSSISYARIRQLWIFKPIMWGLIGTSTFTTPALAQDTVVQQPLEQANAPFFSTVASDEHDETSLFFRSIDSAKNPTEMADTIPIHQINSRIQPSISTSVFFRASQKDTTTARDIEEAHQHVVLRGESLWSIATKQLPQGASSAKIMEETYRLFQLNTDQLETIDSYIYAGQIIKVS